MLKRTVLKRGLLHFPDIVLLSAVNFVTLLQVSHNVTQLVWGGNRMQ